MGNAAYAHVASSACGGKPEKAVGYVDEGSPLGTRWTAPLDPQLAEYGVTEEEWEDATGKLRAAWSKKPVITELNETLFTGKGLVAFYAEYGKGQKAMTIYPQAVMKELEIALAPARSHVKSSGSGGKPDGAIGYVDEGSVLSSKRWTGPLDPQLADKGITEEEWEMATDKLRAAWSKKPVIQELNESLFKPKGCQAVYAEFGPGQKAMTIYALTGDEVELTENHLDVEETLAEEVSEPAA
eukprot:TRINITY_DN41226_c0_g1_i1.p1 TRINITY_DN41226_c0_g1~~TRINITY_DN41226_c0_g1_i1.p1  ORF type:complete len:241 (+),score=60.87 TRINITY_DN41226_c0_g1_i1:46-768(+)